MNNRYIRNYPAVTEKQQFELKSKHVLVIGCGGLGGYLIENMVRLGVGKITAVDGDVFESSNLNRQILSSIPVLGKSKALTAKERAFSVNPDVEFTAVCDFFSEENADELVSGKDLVLDALDNLDARLLMEKVCARHGVTIVHGAILSNMAQVSVVPPGSKILSKIYSGFSGSNEKTSLPHTPSFCAAIQSAEATKLLCTNKSDLEGKLLIADLTYMDWDIIPIA